MVTDDRDPFDATIIVRAPAHRKDELRREARKAGRSLSDHVRDKLFGSEPDPVLERLRQNRRDAMGE